MTEDELYGLISETITETINESGFLQRVASYFNSNNNNQTQKKQTIQQNLTYPTNIGIMSIKLDLEEIQTL